MPNYRRNLMTNNVVTLNNDLRAALLTEKTIDTMRALMETVVDDALRARLQERADRLEQKAAKLRGDLV